MVVTRLVEVTDLDPAVLAHIVGLALLGGLVRVLRADRVYVVLGLVVKLPV